MVVAPSKRAVFCGLLGLLAALAAACSESSESSDPGGASPPGAAGEAGAPAPGPSATPTTPGPTGGPPGPTVTTVRVHYASTSSPAGAPLAPLTLRGSGGPLSWEKSAPVAVASPGLYTWSSPEVTTDLEVKPLLGDTWSRGPNYHLKAGQTLDIYPHFLERHGTVTKKYPSFTSQKLPSTRGIWVYLPPTYVENREARFGVLYMHDAQNLFSATTAFGGVEWQVDETMDAAAETGAIRETIVVGVENTGARIDELTPTSDPTYGGGKADPYLAMVIDEIKPMIDQDLRTVATREHTAIMGSSLGGLVSAYAGVRRADVFGLVGAMSPSTWWGGKVILGEVSSLPTRPAKPLRVYVDSGDSGDSNDDVTNTTELAARYRTAGYTDQKDLLHVVQPGGVHNESAWASRLPAALHFLLGARPD